MILKFLYVLCAYVVKNDLLCITLIEIIWRNKKMFLKN